MADQLTGAPSAIVYVDASCSGGDAMALCLGAVMAFPALWGARLRAAAVGLVVIAAVNTVRIGTLSLVATDRSLFALLHVYVWPATLIVVATAYVFTWMRRQGRSAGRGTTNSGHAWHTPARRFLLLTVVGVAAYFAAAGWFYESDLVRTLAGWVAMTSGGLLAAFGVSVMVSGAVVRTAHGAFIVTQECIATPLIPVYMAAALSVPLTRWRRAAALAAAPAVFFLLGVSRLLVLALPTTLVASPEVAIHAFSQVLVACVIVVGLAVLSARSSSRSHPARRTVGAIGVGIVAALVAGLVWSDLLHWAVDGVQLLVQHSGHRAGDDPQGAVSILLAFQLGLFAAVWVGSGARGPWRRLAGGVLGLAGLQLASLLTLGELSHHVGFAPHVSLIRAWALVAPLALVWVLRRPILPTSSPSPAPAPHFRSPANEPCAQPTRWAPRMWSAGFSAWCSA